jgi:membrane fusion protein, multidrug efflux system
MSRPSSKGNLETPMDNSVRSIDSPRLEASGPPKKKNRARLVGIGLVAAALIGGGSYYVLHLGKESTDDAQVEGHVQPVSPRVNAQVAKVLVRDNQAVKAGDVLVELDRSDFEAKAAAAHADVAAAEAAVASAQTQLELTQRNSDAMLRQARGGVTQASSGVTSSQAAVEQATADVVGAVSRQKLAQREYDRTANLHETGAVSPADLDNHRMALDQANAGLSEARARLLAAKAGVGNGEGAVELAQGRLAAAQTAPQQVASAQAAVKVAEARLLQTQAAQRLADLNLSYTTIRASAGGMVSRRTVEVGQLVSPDRPLLAIVPLDDVWVVANFKEDQAAKMHPGQKATVSVDAYGRDFVGHVDSLSAGTGSRFALLPPDNASGNFIKVVQRVPVLIRLDGAAGVDLRPGMSCTVTVRIAE